jgi:hypothetical protein
MKPLLLTLAFTGILAMLCLSTIAQTATQNLNPIITAFPSLRIPASSRSLSMGDAGVASAIGNDQLYYNAAKTAFTQNFHQVGIGFTPWLASISNDSRFMYVNYLANTGSNSAFGLAFNYFRIGNIQTRDNNGALITQSTASEFSILSSFAIALNDNASIGVGLRCLSNRPGQSLDANGAATIPTSIISASADISYYHKISLGSEEQKLEIGAAITNLGPKISVDGSKIKIFLPTNFGIGVSYTQPNSENTSSFTFALDANKLLVPTPPEMDNAGTITAGKDPNRSILNALFSSFSDAPQGFKEELREIRVNAGAEYAYEKSFLLRVGLSLENKTKGNRKFVGLGAGYKGLINDQSYSIDFHYLVPFGTISAISPFQNSWGFSLLFNIGGFD